MPFDVGLKLHARARFAAEARTSTKQMHRLQVHGGLVNTLSLMNVPLGPNRAIVLQGLRTTSIGGKTSSPFVNHLVFES
jgi:hypothetical protein